MRLLRLTALVAVAGLTTLVGCDIHPLYPGYLLLTTDAASYTVGAEVRVTVVNEGDDPVYVGRCGDWPVLGVERRDGDSWTPVGAVRDECPAMDGASPLVLEAREARVDTYVPSEPGEYRVTASWGTGSTYDLEASSTDPFVVSAP